LTRVNLLRERPNREVGGLRGRMRRVRGQATRATAPASPPAQSPTPHDRSEIRVSAPARARSRISRRSWRDDRSEIRIFALPRADRQIDATFDLEDFEAADEGLHCLVRTVERAKNAGRFRADTDPLELATQSWTIGHGLASLVAMGPLPRQTLTHGIPLLTALFTSAGDDPDRCRQSVEHGWKQLLPPS
jgi:hypothetical protein